MVFYTPNKIVNGGVSGLSTVLFYALGIQPGVSFAVINIILLLLAVKFLGTQFVKDTILGAALISLFVQLFTYLPPMTSDPMLAAIFGAVLYGFGIGLTLTQGASTGGTDSNCF
ncbi:MAG: YitT family protein [Lachnospiraceae bacterium]|nr:YitT family protein [Lachnospiraceae bacterium]